MRYILALLLLTSCTTKYKAGDCFDVRPFFVIEVAEVTDKDYILNLHSLFFDQHRKILEHKVFEKDMKENDLSAISCGEVLGKE